MSAVRRRAPPVEIARALADVVSELHTARKDALRRRPMRGARHSENHRFLKERGIGILITDHNVRKALGILADTPYILTRPGAAAVRQTRRDRLIE